MADPALIHLGMLKREIPEPAIRNMQLREFKSEDQTSFTSQPLAITSVAPQLTLLPSPLFERPVNNELPEYMSVPDREALLQDRAGQPNYPSGNKQYLEALESGFGISTSESLDLTPASTRCVSTEDVQSYRNLTDWASAGYAEQDELLKCQSVGPSTTYSQEFSAQNASYSWPNSVFAVTRADGLQVGQDTFQHLDPYSTSLPSGSIYQQLTPLIPSQSPFQNYLTPQPQGSPFQWTPQTNTPGWHEAQSYASTPLQMPSTMLDYSGSHPDGATHVYQQSRKVQVSLSLPGRRKPHLRPSLSEMSTLHSYSPARLRANSISHSTNPMYEHYRQQVPLPQIPSGDLLLVPDTQHHTTFTAPATPARRPSLAQRSHTTTSLSHGHDKASVQHTVPIHMRRQSSPPPHYFETLPGKKPSAMTPIQQKIENPIDLYTPRWKRRSALGRSEGWCGYCTPGRWLDMKNSRFWEDKLRNHGICAKTKVAFEQPAKVRWVDTDGHEYPSADGNVDADGETIDAENIRRQGLCKTCDSWINMDGVKIKVKGRAVGWWTHAYSCHNHDETLQMIEQQQHQYQQGDNGTNQTFGKYRFQDQQAGDG